MEGSMTAWQTALLPHTGRLGCPEPGRAPGTCHTAQARKAWPCQPARHAPPIDMVPLKSSGSDRLPVCNNLSSARPLYIHRQSQSQLVFGLFLWSHPHKGTL